MWQGKLSVQVKCTCICMRLSIVSVVVALLGTQAALGDQSTWQLNRETVSIGGCVCLIAPASYKPDAATTLIVNGAVIGKLSSVAQEIQSESGYLYLVWWRPANSGDADGPARPIRPLFESVDEFEIVIKANEEETIAGTVHVTPLCPDCDEAMSLLFPVLNDTTQDRNHAFRWSRLLADPEDYCTTKTSDLSLPDDELDQIVRHPDWSEIIPAILSYCQFRQGVREFLGKLAGVNYDRSKVPLPVLTSNQAGILHSEFQDPFARALKKKALREARSQIGESIDLPRNPAEESE